LIEGVRTKLKKLVNPHALEVLVASEAAEYVRLKPAALYELTRRRQIPFVQIGRRYRYLRHQLDEWLLSGGTPLGAGEEVIFDAGEDDGTYKD